MAEQHKRGSLDGIAASQANKKLKAQDNGPSGMVKQEPSEVHRQAEEGKITTGEAAVAVAETIDEPQISLLFGVSLLHCRACLRPVKPPTFKCEAGHVVCSTCRDVHVQACGRAATYSTCPEVDYIVRYGKVPCEFSEFGCPIFPAYYHAADHGRACQWAPCYCPALGCEACTSPARLLDHFCADHGWPVTEVIYGKLCELAVPSLSQLGMHALVVGKEDRHVFLLSASTRGAAVAVSLVCLRAIWVESRRSAGNMAMVMFTVASKDMAGGFVAAEHGSFLAVTPDLLQDASGEAPVLKVRVDKASGGGGGGGSTAARSRTPTSSSSGRQA